MNELMNDTNLRQMFQQSRRTMPPGLEARLLDIPAAESTALRWRAGAMVLAASVLVIFMSGQSLVRLINLASYTLGAWGLERVHSARYALYETVMRQVSPWIESVPLGFTGALIALMAVSLALSLWVIVSKQSNAGLLTPLRSS